MKKVALITKHFAYNYGAVLQCYATQRFIESFGCECEIVDYRTARGIEKSKLFVKPNSLGNVIYDVRNAFSANSFLKRKRNFLSYMDKYYNLTKNIYTLANISSFKADEYDYFVTGSDQTFNVYLAGESGVEEQKSYYWNFLSSPNKISFSASMGEHMSEIESGKEKQWMKEQLLSFKDLSVREKACADFIEKLTGRKAEILIDPTFMLTTDEWDKTIKPTKYDGEDYILFYSVLSEPWVIDYVKAVSEKTGLKVLAPHPKNRFEMGSTGFKRVDYCGPAEFVGLIKNAKLVVTTSFHGTAFSINYKKPFIPIILGEGNRIRNILNLCNLEELAVTEDNKKIDVESSYKIDYTFAESRLKEEREKCKEFMERAIDVK